MFQTIPILQVRENSYIVYDEPLTNQRRFTNPLLSQRMREARKERYSGMISAGARKRIIKAVTLLIQSSKAKWILNPVTKRYFSHRLAFVTLTVSDPEKKMTGKEAYNKLFKHFIAWLRRTEKVNTYIWKAEHQQNGQIHYHITTPSFIHWQHIRDKWNNLQRKAGLLDKYYSKKGHYNANSTDIHKVENIKDLSGYLIKYIAKSYQNENSIGGKVWDCSNNLAGKKYFTLPMTEHHEMKITNDAADKKCSRYTGDRFTVIKYFNKEDNRVLTMTERKKMSEYLATIQNE